MGCFSSKALKEEIRHLKEQLQELGGGVRTVNLIHFNDTYNLIPMDETKYPCGGASRFMDGVRQAREELSDCIVVFSGDFVGPSLMSTVTKGAHIKEALDSVGVEFGCLGNHEWDYGEKNLERLLHGYTRPDGDIVAPSRVEWIASNMFSADGKTPIAGCSEYATITRGGVKVGFLGLAENWLPKLRIPKSSWVYKDMYEVGESMAKKLKKEEGCEIVIALTHSRLEHDRELTKRCPSIDLLLGGHDHFFKHLPKERILKSGQDWEYLSRVSINIYPDGHVKTTVNIDSIDPEDSKDPEMEKLIVRYQHYMESKYGKVLGKTSIDLDSREECLRFKESELGNFLMDCVHDELDSDVKRIVSEKESLAFCVLGGAGIGGKINLPAGSNVTLGDIMMWCPKECTFSVVPMLGEKIKELLEACVKTLSVDGTAECGSFPHCSHGISFTLTVSKPIGSRISDIKIHDRAINLKTKYYVGVEGFIGGDKIVKGIKTLPRVVDDEEGAEISKVTKAWFQSGRNADEEDDMSDDFVPDDLKIVESRLGRITVA